MTDTDHKKKLLRMSLELWHPDCWGIESTSFIHAKSQ